MVDTTNNTAENGENQENPQSILEKRLAEINARTNEGPDAPAEENTGTEEIIGSSIAMHEAIPPTTAIPVDAPVSSDPAAAEVSPGDHPFNAADNNAETSPGPTAGEQASEFPESSQSAPAANPVDSVPFNEVTGENTTTPKAGTMGDKPVAEGHIAGNQPETDEANTTVTEVSSPELLSTAGVINDPLGMSPPEKETINPEAASVPAMPAEASPVSTAAGDEPFAEEDHHDELVPEADYSTLSLPDIRLKLRQTLKTATRQQSREVFDLYRHYEAKLNEEKADALQKFTAEGGTGDDFEYKAGSEHSEIEKSFQLFRESRSRELRQDEEQKVKNAKRKQELLDQLRELVESPETKSSGDKIKQIQSEWKSIGPVPAAESKQLWNSYHALLDIFYNNRSIFNELKELDRRRNLQHKVLLCERAEALIEQPSINVALQELRNLHEEWKHVGPVPNEQRDSIWERFIQASEKVHARKKEFISARKSVELDNLVKKSELLMRMDPYQHFQTDRINDWRDKTDEIQKLKEEWDAIGLVPKERADEINKRFWSSYKAFFNHKNAFFKNLDEQKMQNLRLKTELCEQAESLKDSENWDETKETLIQLQKKWKTVGRVPDKYSDKLWQRFRSACNEFFDRKQNQITQREAELTQASQAKNNLYESLATRVTTISTEPGTVKEFEDFRNNYLALPVTKFSGKTDDRFFDLLQKYVASIADISTDDKDTLGAQLQVTRLKNGPDAGNRIHQKEQSIKRDIGQLENDIRTLKTNIEFFGRSKNAEKLREEYNARIEEADHRIQQLQRQLYLIRNS
jgi:hypothetical protein